MQEEGREGIYEPRVGLGLSFSISQHKAMKNDSFMPQGWCMGSFQCKCKEKNFLS